MLARKRWQGGEDTNGCGESCVQHRSVARWKVAREWDDAWLGDGVECGELLKSDPVESTEGLGASGRRLAGWDQNHDRIG